MGPEQKIVVGSLLFSALVSYHLFLYLRSKGRENRCVFYLAWIMACGAWWAGWNAVEYLVEGLGAKLFAADMQYAAISSVSVLWYSFGLSYLNEERRKPRRNPRPAIWIVPALTAALVWLDPLLGLVRRNIRLERYDGTFAIAKDFGPWFWVLWVYSYLFLALGSLFILRGAFVRKGRNRVQIAVLVAGTFLPSAANFAYVVGLFPVPQVDPTPIAFSLSALLLLYNLTGLHFMPFIGAAREDALENLRDAVLIFDRRSALAYANAAAREVFGPAARRVGASFAELGPELGRFADLREGEEREAALGADPAGRRRYEATMSSVRRLGREIGRTLTFRDVTRRTRAEDSLKEANRHLEDRVAERTRALEETNARLTEELEHRTRTERQL